MDAMTVVGNAGATQQYTNGNDFYPQSIQLIGTSTLNAASARISVTNEDQSGLRFKTTYTAAYIDELKALAAEKNETLEIGTLIAPKSYVEAAGAFTHAALAAKYAENPYVQVVAVVDAPFASGNGVITYAGSIVNIKKNDMEFAGIGYVKIGDTYYYSESYCVRDIATVATAALADTSSVANDVYKFTIEAGVSYSPYTVGQRLILSKLNGTFQG